MKILKILILRLSSIGDIIHTLPSLYLLKKYLPNSFISWVSDKEPSSLIRNNILLDKIFIFNDFPRTIFSDYNILTELKSIEWDIIIDYHFFFKTLILRSFLFGKVYTFSYHDVYNFEEYINYKFSNVAINCSMVENKTNKFLNLTKGVLQDILKIDINTEIDKNKFTICENNLINYNKNKKIISLCPNCSELNRIWKIQNWINLIKELIKLNDFEILLIGLDFTEVGNNIKKIIDNSKFKNRVTILPKMSLVDTASILTQSSIFIGHDSCILHIANFLNVNTIGIYGPTCGKWNCSYYKNCRVLQGKTKFKRYRNHFDKECINQVLVKDVLNLI